MINIWIYSVKYDVLEKKKQIRLLGLAIKRTWVMGIHDERFIGQRRENNIIIAQSVWIYKDISFIFLFYRLFEVYVLPPQLW